MTPIKKALIIRQPHVDNILDDLKSWEMRGNKTSVRGRIGIIEAGSGMIMGEVDLVDSLDPITPKEIQGTYDKHCVMDMEKLIKWRFPWVLENPVRYEKPVPYHHPQGAVIWVNLSHG